MKNGFNCFQKKKKSLKKKDFKSLKEKFTQSHNMRGGKIAILIVAMIAYHD